MAGAGAGAGSGYGGGREKADRVDPDDLAEVFGGFVSEDAVVVGELETDAGDDGGDVWVPLLGARGATEEDAWRMLATAEFVDTFSKLPVITEGNIAIVRDFVGSPGPCVMFSKAATSSGKTIGLPATMAAVGSGDVVVMCALPTVASVVSAKEFAQKNLRVAKSGSTTRSHVVGHSYAGFVQYKLKKPHHVVYATTKHVSNYLLRMYSEWRAVSARTKTTTLLPAGFVLMVDEAHHGTMETAFLLLLARWLMARGFLSKVVIASATLDIVPVPFDAVPGVRMMELDMAARSHELTVHYCPRPIPMRDLMQRTVDMVCNIAQVHSGAVVLAFVSGSQEADKMQESITRKMQGLGCMPPAVFVLYSSLTSEEMREVLQAPDKYRKEGLNRSVIIVATNAAESSVTIKGVAFVVDTGLQKRMELRPSGMGGSLKETRVSQANATQRMGRAGRTEPGTAYCMYTKEEFSEFQGTSPSELHTLDPVMVVLEVLAHKLPLDMLCLPSAKVQASLDRLRRLQLIERDGEVGKVGDRPGPGVGVGAGVGAGVLGDTGCSDVDDVVTAWRVTPAGYMVQKFPVDLELAVIASDMQELVETAPPHSTQQARTDAIAVLALVAMMDAAQGGSFFYVPRDVRQDSELRMQFTEEHFRYYRGMCDLCTYLRIFAAMFEDESMHLRAMKEAHFNMKQLIAARRTFEQLTEIVLGCRATRDMVLEAMLRDRASDEVYMTSVRTLIGAVYSQMLLKDPHVIGRNKRPRIAYKTRTGETVVVDSMRSFCEYTRTYRSGLCVVAPHLMEVTNAMGSSTIYASCIFPYQP